MNRTSNTPNTYRSLYGSGSPYTPRSQNGTPRSLYGSGSHRSSQNIRKTLPTPSKLNNPQRYQKFLNAFEKMYPDITKVKNTPGGTTSVMFDIGNNKIVKIAESNLRTHNTNTHKKRLENELLLAIKAGNLGLGPNVYTNRSGVVSINSGGNMHHMLVLTMQKMTPLTKQNSENKNIQNQIHKLKNRMIKSGFPSNTNNHFGQYVTKNGKVYRIDYGRFNNAIQYTSDTKPTPDAPKKLPRPKKLF